MKMNTTNGTTLLCNGTMSFCVKTGHFENTAIATTSILLLCAMTFIGTTLNVVALHKVFKQNWKNYLSIIQLLVTGCIVCSVLAPIQIIRTALSFTRYEFMGLCQCHHFIHLHTDSCAFVTMIIISYERLSKIFWFSKQNCSLTYKKLMLQFSWLLSFPIVVYITYKDNSADESISIFTTDCVLSSVGESHRPIVETVSAICFLGTLLVIATIYLIAIHKLWRKMTNRVGNVNTNIQPSQNASPTTMQPREATRINITSIGANELTRSKSVYPIGKELEYTLEPRSNSVTTTNYDNVLSELTNKYADTSLKRHQNNTQSNLASLPPVETAYEDQLIRLRKFSETVLNQSKVKAKSSIADALGKMSSISLFQINDPSPKGFLNPLKHTRLNPSNACIEELKNQNKCNNLKPSSIIRKKKLPWKHTKLKREYSSDSIGNFSDTSGFTDLKTDDDASYITCNTETANITLGDPSNNISVIIEQPEAESLHSRQNYTESKPKQINVKSLHKTSDLSDNLLSDDEIKMRSLSASFKSKDEFFFSQDVDFRRRAQTESVKTRPRIKSQRKRSARKLRKNKSRISRSSENVTWYSSTDNSESDYYSSNQRKSINKLDSSILDCSGGDPMIKHNPMSKFTSQRGSNKEELKLVDSSTQTDDSIMVMNSDSITQNKWPEVRIIVPRENELNYIRCSGHVEHESLSPISYKAPNTPQSSCSIAESSRGSQLQVPMSPINLTASMTSLRSTVNKKSDFKQIIKRSTLIILALAIFYLPTCVAAFLLSNISHEKGIHLIQITRSVQYMYFAVLPMIYVFTNQGLMKSSNRPTRPSSHRP